MDKTEELFEKIKNELRAIRHHQRELKALNDEILREPGFENYGPEAIEAYSGKVEKAILAEYQECSER